MIKLLIITALLASSSYANLMFACESFRRCLYSEQDQDYTDCSKDVMSPSLFELDDGGRIFTHTTADITSTYYIKTSEYNAESKILFLTVVSDVGNKYSYAFSVANKRVAAQGVDQDGVKFMLILETKSVYKE